MRNKNLAGAPPDVADTQCCLELAEAGIEIHQMEMLRSNNGEVKTKVAGSLHSWLFKRAWYYWVCTGPGIPPAYADELHKLHGQEVRVDGHCGCPSPREWFKGFACSQYHVDTQAGLNALAATIRKVVEDAEVVALQSDKPAEHSELSTTSEAPQQLPQFDASLDPQNITNMIAAKAHGLRYDSKSRSYIDADGCMIRDRFGQAL